MYIRLTPMQLKKLKEFIKTVELKAYDITIYNEIKKSLEFPIDEYQKNKDVTMSNVIKEDIKNNIYNKVQSDTDKRMTKNNLLEQSDGYYTTKNKLLSNVSTPTELLTKLTDKEENIDETDVLEEIENININDDILEKRPKLIVPKEHLSPSRQIKNNNYI